MHRETPDRSRHRIQGEPLINPISITYPPSQSSLSCSHVIIATGLSPFHPPTSSTAENVNPQKGIRSRGDDPFTSLQWWQRRNREAPQNLVYDEGVMKMIIINIIADSAETTWFVLLLPRHNPLVQRIHDQISETRSPPIFIVSNSATQLLNARGTSHWDLWWLKQKQKQTVKRLEIAENTLGGGTWIAVQSTSKIKHGWFQERNVVFAYNAVCTLPCPPSQRQAPLSNGWVTAFWRGKSGVAAICSGISRLAALREIVSSLSWRSGVALTAMQLVTCGHVGMIVAFLQTWSSASSDRWNVNNHNDVNGSTSDHAYKQKAGRRYIVTSTCCRFRSMLNAKM